jgi:hypothetical protein
MLFHKAWWLSGLGPLFYKKKKAWWLLIDNITWNEHKILLVAFSNPLKIFKTNMKQHSFVFHFFSPIKHILSWYP